MAMDAMGSMRDLDQIQERDDVSHSSRLMSIALGAIATACVLFAVGVMVGREAGDARPTPREDPLAQLDRLAQRPEAAAAANLTYAERLTGSPAGSTPTSPAVAAAGPAQPGAVANATAQLLGVRRWPTPRSGRCSCRRARRRSVASACGSASRR